MEKKTQTPENATVAEPVKEKRIQLTISQLEELSSNQKLMEIFKDIIRNEDDIKAPIAIQIARREAKQ